MATFLTFGQRSTESMYYHLTIFFTILSAGLVQLPAATGPLIHAHSHNDYEHPRPLLDALDHGFCGVEADIYLVDGQLLVAHDRDKVKPERTLQALYLDPLRERGEAEWRARFCQRPGVRPVD
jgi:hypothetical protein